MSKIRIGVIGCGGMAKAHASRFETLLDKLEVSALVDLERDRAQAVADLLPNEPLVTTDYKEALAEIDAALIALPHHLHHRVAIDCLGAGKHVLCEKPLTDAVSSLEGLQVIWKLYEAEDEHKLADLRGLGFGSVRV